MQEDAFLTEFYSLYDTAGSIEYVSSHPPPEGAAIYVGEHGKEFWVTGGGDLPDFKEVGIKGTNVTVMKIPAIPEFKNEEALVPAQTSKNKEARAKLEEDLKSIKFPEYVNTEGITSLLNRVYNPDGRITHDVFAFYKDGVISSLVEGGGSTAWVYPIDQSKESAEAISKVITDVSNRRGYSNELMCTDELSNEYKQSLSENGYTLMDLERTYTTWKKEIEPLDYIHTDIKKQLILPDPPKINPDAPISSNPESNWEVALNAIPEDQRDSVTATFVNEWKKSFSGTSKLRDICTSGGDLNNTKDNYIQMHPEDMSYEDLTRIIDYENGHTQIRNGDSWVRGSWIFPDKLGVGQIVEAEVNNQFPDKTIIRPSELSEFRNQKFKEIINDPPEHLKKDIEEKLSPKSQEEINRLERINDRGSLTWLGALKDMDTLYSNAIAPSDQTIVRGISKSVVDKLGLATDVLPGDQVHLNHYTSWTTDQGNANYYGYHGYYNRVDGFKPEKAAELGEKLHFMVTDVKEGDPAIVMSDKELIRGEQETVLGRDEHLEYDYTESKKIRYADNQFNANFYHFKRLVNNNE